MSDVSALAVMDPRGNLHETTMTSELIKQIEEMWASWRWLERFCDNKRMNSLHARAIFILALHGLLLPRLAS